MSQPTYKPAYSPIRLGITSSFSKSSQKMEQPHTRQHKLTITSQSEQLCLLKRLQWRKTTKMPIIRVHSFKAEGTAFPKTYTMQIQEIEKSVKDLKCLELHYCLYLINECLMGIQALEQQFVIFDFHSVFYGVTCAGLCQVWINRQLTAFQPQPLPLPHPDIIILSVLKMVYNVCGTEAQQKLLPFIQQISKVTNFSYSHFHFWLRQFANQNISSRLISQRSPIRVRKAMVNTRSSISFDKNSEKQYQAIKSLSCNKIETSQYISESGLTIVEQKPKTISQMLTNSSRLKQKLKKSKNQKISSQSQIKTNMFYLPKDSQLKSEKTCTSLTINAQDSDLTAQKYGVKCVGRLNTANVGDGEKIGSRSAFDSQTSILDWLLSPRAKQELTQSKELVQAQFENFMKLAKNKYQFGGLLPIEQRSIQQSIQIEDLDHPDFAQQQSVLNSIQLSPQRPWRNMQNLLTDDMENLKESVYCGEEKFAPHLDIKLEKLGLLGRPITSIMRECDQH